MGKFSATILFALLFTGCWDSDQQPKEKAERLSQQANTEIASQNYEESERLLAEVIDIYAEANNDAKLAENYAVLSSVQVLAGKIVPALETLAAVRELYKSAADRTAELHTMFQMAKLHFQLGNTAEAIRLLHEAYSSSAVYRLDNLHALAGLEAGKLHLTLHQYVEAVPYLTAAQQYFKSMPDIPRLVETNTAMIDALTPLGKTDEAYTVFQQVESIFAANDPGLNRPKFYRETGTTFSRTEDVAFARANYLQAISILDQNNTAGNSEERILSLLGLGELYFNNFSFPEAQQYYVAAYTLAKESSSGYLQAYLLIRISDCLSKVSVFRNAKEGMIRASQLYEQAQTLFARQGFGLGEAIATQRLGMLKELSGDEGAAITFYKRSFEKYLDNTVPPEHYTLPVPVEQLYSTSSRSYGANEWFSERLIAVLLKVHRYAEALTYYETMRSVSLQQELKDLPFMFRDPGKRTRYVEFTSGLREKFQLQLELFHLGSTNKNYASKLQQRLKYIRSKVESDAITLMREYPVFTFIGFSQQSLRQMMNARLASTSTLADFCLVNNELWVFIFRSNAEISAVKLSSYANTVGKQMQRMIDGLQSPSLQRNVLSGLSQELYALLLKPIESSLGQKLIIIPPVHFEKFPFHSLMNGEVPVTEMTNIVYMPHVALINSTAQIPRFINNVVTVGFTPDFRWGLEFELRDTRSFFRNTQVLVNQSATEAKLDSALGEILQISSQYVSNLNREYSFTVSDGSASKSGIAVPVAKFTSLHPFQIVYLSDAQTTTNTMSDLHPILWFLNGSAGIVATQFPITSTISKTFGENFYSSLSMEINPSLAYRRAVTKLGKMKDYREGFGGASYFYYGNK
ncbi:MAG: CHAT domain-containing protein [Bacteroidota bacterium]